MANQSKVPIPESENQSAGKSGSKQPIFTGPAYKGGKQGNADRAGGIYRPTKSPFGGK